LLVWQRPLKSGKAQRGDYLCAFQSNLIIDIYNEVMQKFNNKEENTTFFLEKGL